MKEKQKEKQTEKKTDRKKTFDLQVQGLLRKRWTKKFPVMSCTQKIKAKNILGPEEMLGQKKYSHLTPSLVNNV